MQITQCQSQIQAATPQTILCRQLLLLPVLSLESFLAKAVMDNPFLELCCEDGKRVVLCGIPAADCTGEEDAPLPGKRTALPLLEEICGSQGMTLQDFLRLQAGLLRNISQRERETLECLIQAVDDAGYLREPLGEISAAAGCSETCAEHALKLVQSFSPRGVGARTLAECLLLQIEPGEKDAGLLRRMIQEDLEALAQHRYTALEKKYHISGARIQQILRRIRSMEPRPGAACSADHATPFIYPDASIRLFHQELVVEIYGSAKSLLRFDAGYMAGVSDPEAQVFLSEKRSEAISLLNSLHMRYQAMSRLLHYLAAVQGEFFVKGPQALRPLLVKDAAAAIGVHPSTVSRCVSGKYIDTPWGTYPLRYFFQTAAGACEVAPETVRQAISALIAEEDKTAPISDQSIANALEAQGMHLSRRTVSKYRQEMGISGQRLRRQYG